MDLHLRSKFLQGIVAAVFALSCPVWADQPNLSSPLVSECIGSIFGRSVQTHKILICEYTDVPREIEPLADGEKRVIEDGVVCVGYRSIGENRAPMLVQLEKQSSFTPEAVPGETNQRTENVYPQYVYQFDKIKESRHGLKLRERAPKISNTAERDTQFTYSKKAGSGSIHMRFWYGGRLFATPYSDRRHPLRCSVVEP